VTFVKVDSKLIMNSKDITRLAILDQTLTAKIVEENSRKIAI
jgi:hypothetical protein